MRGSVLPVACADSSRSIGRKSFPFIRSRWSFTSAMPGKSAAMMRRSSSATRARSCATGRWMSCSVTGATCWLISARLGQRLHALAHVQEPDVHREHFPIQILRLGGAALLLARAAEPVENAQPLLVTRGGQLEAPSQDRLGHTEGPLLEEADAEGLGGPELPVVRAEGLLELRDRLVEQTHFLECHAQVVVRLEVGLLDVLVDALLEARQHLLEVLLLVAGGLLVLDLHPGVPRLVVIVVEDHGPQ